MTEGSLFKRLEAMRVTGACREGCVTQFEQFLKQAPDDQLFRMSPLRYAGAQDIPEAEAVDLFLRATHAGILDFSWGVLCPACLGFITTRTGLRSLNEDRKCNFCRIPVPGMVDDNVEVAFTVAPAVRKIHQHGSDQLEPVTEAFPHFFSPSLDPEDGFYQALRSGVKTGGSVGGAQKLESKLDLPAGRWVLMAPESHSVVHFDTLAEGGARKAEVEILDGICIPDLIEGLACDAELVLHNRYKAAVSYVIMVDPVPPPELRPPGMQPPDHRQLPFLSGKRLITAQAFRELFQAESIPSEGGLELKNLTVLFTDLKSSTEMYERIGDFKAYDLVRRHFHALLEVVANQGGAVVKTIGDAIMASFAESTPALVAAVEMNREVAGVGEGEDLQLKIGLHAGPCIAVELNDRLDYFGRTVNIAARVQGVAGASEIVVTEPVHSAPGAVEVIQQTGLQEVRDQVSLKGIEDDMPVIRLQPGS